MIAMSRNGRYLSSEGAPGKDAIPPGALCGPPHVVARDGSQPGFDSRALLLPPWLTAAMASGPPAFVNRMVRRWISRQAFGTERFSSPAE
jgi:hypothetical protein